MTHAMPAFDTLKYAESLQAAGVPETQAKAHARAAADAYDVQLQRLATTEDVRLSANELRGEMTILGSELRGEMTILSSELRGEMATLRSELRSEISDLRSDLKLVKWVCVTTAAAILSQIAKGFM